MIKKLVEKCRLLIMSVSIDRVIIIAFILPLSLIGIKYIYNCVNQPFEQKISQGYIIYEESMRLEYYAAKEELSERVQSYIDSIAPYSALSGLYLTDKCFEYDIDICFVLAHGQQESHFGTTGLSRKTNSVFNVMAYDNTSLDKISMFGKYATPNASVVPYMELLSKRYLINNKTEYDMLNKFVDINGKRYASNVEYERLLRDLYKNIKEKTDIDTLYQKVRKYKLLLG